MAVDRELVNIILARRPSNGDPKLPRSTRLSPKPFKSMPYDHPGGSQSQPRGASVQKGPQSDFKTVQHLFLGTPLQAKSSKVLRLPTKSSLAELAGHSYVYLPLSTFATFIYVCYVSDAASAAQSPLSTRAGGKDDGS